MLRLSGNTGGGRTVFFKAQESFEWNNLEASGKVLSMQKKVASVLVFCSIRETGAYVMKG